MCWGFFAAKGMRMSALLYRATFFCLLLLMVSYVAHAQDTPSSASTGKLEAIASLDLPRYLGRWYEIAKFPNRFQKQCVANTTAEYSMDAGAVKVVNRCQLANGAVQEAVGAARQLGAANSAKLEVRFAPAWLSFVPQVWGSYWVIDLDASYQLAAVSEPSGEYLWILSRSPKVDPARYAELLSRLQEKGLNIKQLELTPQP
jgi:apolipoprotein D and lipocalin family protein